MLKVHLFHLSELVLRSPENVLILIQCSMFKTFCEWFYVVLKLFPFYIHCVKKFYKYLLVVVLRSPQTVYILCVQKFYLLGVVLRSPQADQGRPQGHVDWRVRRNLVTRSDQLKLKIFGKLFATVLFRIFLLLVDFPYWRNFNPIYINMFYTNWNCLYS